MPLGSINFVGKAAKACSNGQYWDQMMNGEQSVASQLGTNELVAGRYLIGDVVGEGGMGLVRAAWDFELGRNVAVKVLKPGIDADSAVKRFQVEARITGRLQHPGIPPVYQLGSLDDGLPFLAMKLVEGSTLSKLLKDQTDPAADRSHFINIFEQICNAVGYAHSLGVIHRDLKPGNIMVGAHGEVQVMDWGLAKVVGAQRAETFVCNTRQEDSASTVEAVDEADTVTYREPAEMAGVRGLQTHAGSAIGTPAYMPPEQAAGDVANITVRSDVFSLGAILFEILVGRRLYIGKSREDIIAEAALCNLDAALALLDSAAAEAEIVALCKRCLSADQADRPVDGSEVAHTVAEIIRTAEARARNAELQRAVAVEETKRVKEIAEAEARRAAEQTAAEKSKRKVLFRGLVGVSAALALGLFLTSLQMGRADLERSSKERAMIAQQEANERALAAIKGSNDTRSKNVAKWETGVNLLARIVSSFDPLAEKQGGASLITHLRMEAEAIARELDSDAKDDSVRLANVQTQMASVLIRLGAHQTALPMLEQSVGAQKALHGKDDKNVLTALIYLGDVYHKAGRYAEAISSLEPTREVLLTRLHAGDRSVLDSWFALASSYKLEGRLPAAKREYSELVGVLTARYGENDSKTVEARALLASVSRGHGTDLKAAGGRLAGGEDHKTKAIDLNNLEKEAVEQFKATKFKEALAIQRRVFEAAMKDLGKDSPVVMSALSNYAGIRTRLGLHNDAARDLKDVFDFNFNRLGPRHSTTLLAFAALAQSSVKSGREDTVKNFINNVNLRPYHSLNVSAPRELTALHCLATFCGKFPDCHVDSIGFIEHVLEVEERLLGAAHPDRCNLVTALGHARWHLKHGDRSKSKVVKSWGRVIGVLGLGDSTAINDEENLNVNLAMCGRFLQGSGPIKAYDDSVGGAIKGSFVDGVVNGFVKARRGGDAEKLINHLLTAERQTSLMNSSFLARRLVKYGCDFMAFKNYGKAETLLSEAVAICDKTAPGTWSTYYAHLMVGFALRAQNKQVKANPYLMKGVLGMTRIAMIRN